MPVPLAVQIKAIVDERLSAFCDTWLAVLGEKAILDDTPAIQGDVERRLRDAWLAEHLSRLPGSDFEAVVAKADEDASGLIGVLEEANFAVGYLVGLEFVRQRDGLERDLAIDTRVTGPVDDAHGALAELVQDLVASEPRRNRGTAGPLAGLAARRV